MSKTDKELFYEALGKGWNEMMDYIDKIDDPELRGELYQRMKDKYHMEEDW